MKREIITAADGKALSVAVWECEAPKAMVQISHGMAEHIARYDAFAQYLNARGFLVFGDDHRGHGETDPEALGLAGEGDIFALTVEDMRALSRRFRERYGLPLVLLGHSYGSFLSQAYLLRGTDELAGCVLSGSALMAGAAVKMGRAIAKARLKKKKDQPGDILAGLTFRSYDRKFKEGLNAWLSRDKAEVGKYNVDPYCGYTCSYGFYYWFFGGLLAIAGDNGAAANPAVRLYLTSGQRDHVGGKDAKLVQKLAARYRAMGYEPTVKIYENARHEILNEIDRQAVYADILAFIESCIA
ncbi:MAG: alpha/beta hydrolase [Clostridiales bacterium]|jgi:alpha-beta hydrolase superfamily lysophospholipase|nr:alpha/beta hydrolase [Clostridiales bacterium]